MVMRHAPRTPMHTFTVQLDERDYARMEKLAINWRLSKAEIVRRGINRAADIGWTDAGTRIEIVRPGVAEVDVIEVDPSW